MREELTTVARADFPDDFAWGTATASYQIEGATDRDGRGPSIWDAFAATPGAIADGSAGDVADDHYRRFREDVKLMAGLGVNAYRFSIAWPRIQPTGTGPANPLGLAFYRDLAEALLEHGITPYATLYHWDLPLALERTGGWLQRDTAERLADYTSLTVTALGDVVKNWITVNEPWCSAFLGYGSGVHAPGRRTGSHAARAAHHLLLGHGRSVEAIRAAQPDATVGVTLNLYSVRPASETAIDLDAARRIDGLQNRFFLDPILAGSYPADVLADLGEVDWFAALPDSDAAEIAAPIDFLGVNYYSRHTVAGSSGSEVSNLAYPGSESVAFVDAGAPRTQMGWPIHSDGLIDVLELAHAYRPGLPLCITENGAAYADAITEDGEIIDTARRDYIVEHVATCAEAVRRGLPLRGYFAWSLMDNWEWAWGYSRRFGLAYVDYQTQERIVKDSGRWYSAFLRASAEAGSRLLPASTSPGSGDR